MISFCCFQLLYSNTLCVVHNSVFISWFLLFCVLCLVCPTLFPLFCFHSKKLPVFRLFLKNKSGALRLASLALPLCLTNANASVKFRKLTNTSRNVEVLHHLLEYTTEHRRTGPYVDISRRMAHSYVYTNLSPHFGGTYPAHLRHCQHTSF